MKDGLPGGSARADGYTTGMRPLVLLDVDGVLNALGPPDGSWDDWRYGSAAALGRDWPIRFSPTVVAAVRGWTETADVNWLTTWGHEANTGLGDLLGLAELPVAGTPDGPTEPAAQTVGALSAVTPAAPDRLTGRWWKLDVVRALVGRQPGRRLVWVDDDLAADPVGRAWVRGHADCLMVAPDPLTGLVAGQLAAVAAFLLASQ